MKLNKPLHELTNAAKTAAIAGAISTVSTTGVLHADVSTVQEKQQSSVIAKQNLNKKDSSVVTKNKDISPKIAERMKMFDVNEQKKAQSSGKNATDAKKVTVAQKDKAKPEVKYNSKIYQAPGTAKKSNAPQQRQTHYASRYFDDSLKAAPSVTVVTQSNDAVFNEQINSNNTITTHNICNRIHIGSRHSKFLIRKLIRSTYCRVICKVC
jgi:hypothetical protein